jgi:flagellar hook assembly protein FlgD
LHDALGRPVRRLAGKSRGGSVVFSWDGRDESGRPVESGLYLARTVAGREEQTVVFTYLEE